MNEEFWKYCTARQCGEMIGSLGLLDHMSPKMTEEQKICLLYSLSNHVEDHYHKVSIPKKSGGYRHLQVPDTLLKNVQRNISRHVLQNFSVSSYALAYRKGGDIRRNALPHVGRKKLLKLDIQDFFGSITYLSVYNLAFPGVYFPPPVRTLLANLCCYRDCLPQGSPASPHISNLVMKPFDEYIGKWCAKRDILYTRYCDDMTFSGDFDAGEVRGKVRGFLNVLGFELNHRKTKVVGYGQQQMVTGIVVNQKMQVSKEYRRNLRQEIYYCLKYGVQSHLKQKSGKPGVPTEESCRRYLDALMGRIAYVLQINPEDRWFQNAREQIRLLWELPETERKGNTKAMKTSDFYYDLPQELIAQDPLEDRSASRLMHLDKVTGEIGHGQFRDILHYLQPGDCLVINDTKVIPARLYGRKVGTDAAIEILLLKRNENDIWETLVKPGKKCKPGTVISFGDGLLTGEVLDVVEEGNRLIQFHYEGIFEEILDRLGEMPLPPYITHKLQDKNRYQTVYAKHEGSAAAPTAGLHFTKELLEQVEKMGVRIAHVTLHVGLGTFRPVKVEDVTQHHMHSEFYIVEEDQAKLINDTKTSGHRVISVGTTSCRTLESAAAEDGMLKAGSGWTDIFIYPGYQFKIIDGLITNFHLPESTLLMLVSALAGKAHVMSAYEEAVKERYRFFSFGDAMFIQ